MAATTSPRRPPPPALSDDCALFLDVDGTLLEFAPQPHLAGLPDGLLETIERVGDYLHGALALVSGRPLAQIDRLFAPLRLPAAGLHGQELRDAPPAPRTPSAALAAFKREAAALAAQHPGVLVEDKGDSIALHWRNAPNAADALHALAAARVAQLPDHRLQPGDHVVEIVPADADKGRALRALMARPPFRGRRPVFVGDDLTDEYGFAAANALGGWSVRVGAREPSRATHALPDPRAVHAWLRMDQP
ncbi:MAG: trehalose-phosphatase [Pseudoxanthomonas sp.]